VKVRFFVFFSREYRHGGSKSNLHVNFDLAARGEGTWHIHKKFSARKTFGFVVVKESSF
tara:strand:+ start:25936 stop:26112 length:177 start_codon:yes stop_codon:yes gene_type:complete